MADTIKEETVQQPQHIVGKDNHCSSSSTNNPSNPIILWNLAKLCTSKRPSPFRQVSKSTIQTTDCTSWDSTDDNDEDQNDSSNSNTNDDDEVISDNTSNTTSKSSSSTNDCTCCNKRYDSIEMNIETTLTKSGNVTICSCIKTLDRERKILKNNHTSINELNISGEQLIKLGDYKASRLRYQLLLETLQKNESINYYKLANICYTCGQLSRKLNDYSLASHYFQLELEYTSKFTSSTTRSTTSTGTNEHNTTTTTTSASTDFCMAKCYHALAKLHQYDMGDADASIQYYQQALLLEQAAFIKIKNNLCTKCEETTIDDSNNNNNEYYCEHIINQLKYMQQQIQDTKRCIGRIHFQNGNLDQALRLTIRK